MKNIDGLTIIQIKQLLNSLDADTRSELIRELNQEEYQAEIQTVNTDNEITSQRFATGQVCPI